MSSLARGESFNGSQNNLIQTEQCMIIRQFLARTSWSPMEVDTSAGELNYCNTASSSLGSRPLSSRAAMGNARGSSSTWLLTRHSQYIVF